MLSWAEELVRALVDAEILVGASFGSPGIVSGARAKHIFALFALCLDDGDISEMSQMSSFQSDHIVHLYEAPVSVLKHIEFIEKGNHVEWNY